MGRSAEEAAAAGGERGRRLGYGRDRPCSWRMSSMAERMRPSVSTQPSCGSEPTTRNLSRW